MFIKGGQAYWKFTLQLTVPAVLLIISHKFDLKYFDILRSVNYLRTAISQNISALLLNINKVPLEVGDPLQVLFCVGNTGSSL